MPSPNVVKVYVPGGIYHVYNRGVEKREIFSEPRDFAVFLHYLKTSLSVSVLDGNPRSVSGSTTAKCDLHSRIQLLAYCLMPNHYHLLLQQLDAKAMTELVKRVSNGYVEYFNRKYKRVGSLFQGSYKAVIVNDGPQLLHLTRYLHRNPLDLIGRSNWLRLADYPYSSYQDYLGMRATDWLKPGDVLYEFRGSSADSPQVAYREFVELDDNTEEELLAMKTIDECFHPLRGGTP
jgi:putative transposase